MFVLKFQDKKRIRDCKDFPIKSIDISYPLAVDLQEMNRIFPCTYQNVGDRN